jgi:hypothetical protein
MARRMHVILMSKISRLNGVVETLVKAMKSEGAQDRVADLPVGTLHHTCIDYFETWDLPSTKFALCFYESAAQKK